MSKVISIINLKGGVAKTTTTVQLAECLVTEFDKKVLVIDLDPQTNATVALINDSKWEKLDDENKTLYHLFNDKLEKTTLFNIDKAIQTGVSNLYLNNLHLLASNIKFISIQDRISEIPQKCDHTINPMEVLKTVIQPILADYDYVLIDCPPNLGFITKNGLEISDYYFIPTIPDRLSTYGIPQIVSTIDNFAKMRKLKVRCMGLLMTKYSSNSEAHKAGKRTLPARFKDMFKKIKSSPAPVFSTVMPQANATSDAMQYNQYPDTFKQKYGYSKSLGKPLHQYVVDLTKEFIQNAR